MKKAAIFFLMIFLTSCSLAKPAAPVYQINLNSKKISMKLTSTAFRQGENLPGQYTCDGENINPPLEISDVPSQAQSLALIFDDPDAPAGTFIHWLVWNIDPQTKVIAENSVPANAIQGTNSGHKAGYYPPCPPSGSHRYIFKLYALDTKLDLPAGADNKSLEKAMSGHTLDYSELIGLYQRN